MDTLSEAERSVRMAKVKSTGSRAEMAVRSLVHRMGFRYRLHDRHLPGSPDLVFPSKKKVIFVHGCFWHQHPAPDCKLARMPKSKLEFWQPKLQGNRERDVRQQEALIRLGWNFLLVWECELRDKEQLKNRILSFLNEGLA